MELVLTKRSGKENYLPTFSEEMLIYWLWVNNVHVGKGREQFHVEYNNAYHFYDIHLYALLMNHGEAQTQHFEEAVRFFTSRGYKVSQHATFRWATKEDGTSFQIPGLRIWVHPMTLEEAAERAKKSE